MLPARDWDDHRLGRFLKLRDLTVLRTVARCGSMGKAAAQLSVSHPSIYKTIAEMEKTLGVRLLDRAPQGVTPTVFAETLLERGAIAFDELRQAIRDQPSVPAVSARYLSSLGPGVGSDLPCCRAPTSGFGCRSPVQAGCRPAPGSRNPL